MSKQNYAIEQNNISSTNLDEEFENVEKIVLSVFRVLKEYDNLMGAAETEMKKIRDKTLDC